MDAISLQTYKEKLHSNVPDELKEIKKWLLWKKDIVNGKVRKIPVRNGYPFDITQKDNLLSFNTAALLLNNGDVDGLGFAFSKDDPYTGIDLDGTENPQERQLQADIFNHFKTYSELSPSGNGLHLIVKGKIPESVTKKPFEMYSDGQYFTVTGEKIGDYGIENKQDDLRQLFEFISNKKVLQIESKCGDPQGVTHGMAHCYEILNKYNKERFSDSQIIQMVLDNQISNLLYNGIIPDGADLNELDMSLCNYIVNFGAGFEQTGRIFMSSELGKRDKVINRKDYLMKTIAKAFNKIELSSNYEFKDIKKQIEESTKIKLKSPVGKATSNSSFVCSGKTLILDKDGNEIPFIEKGNEIRESHRIVFEKVNERYNNEGFTFPPGMIGDIAKLIYAMADRPVPELALAGSIGFMAGLCGRQYNINGTGLNQYIVTIAETGTGKDAILKGINSIIGKIKDKCPAVEKMIGPCSIGSNHALLQYLSKNRYGVCILDEFADEMERFSNKRDQIGQSLKTFLTKLYTLSGKNRWLDKSVYADKLKNIGNIESPALTLLGESAPKRFFDALESDLIVQGFIPRFLIFQYDGSRTDRNIHSNNAFPDEELIDNLTTLSGNIGVMESHNTVVDVLQSKESHEVLTEFDKYCDSQIRDRNNDDVLKHLYSRGHLIAWKLAGIIAIGNDMHKPIISEDESVWACNLVKNNIEMLIDKFRNGETGTSNFDSVQLKAIKQAISQYFTMPNEEKEKYKILEAHVTNGIIPHSYFIAMLLNNPCFHREKFSANISIKRQLDICGNCGILAELPVSVAMGQYGTRQKLYQVLEAV